MHCTKLYKRTSVGKVQEWHIEYDEDHARYRTISGQLDGELVTSGWSQAAPKNVGRSNETTAFDQAELEIEAKYTKKLAQGQYKKDIKDIDIKDYFKPMLAKKYDDYAPLYFASGSVYTQPKLDGIRCIATDQGLFSRAGKPIEACPHIFEALEDFFTQNPEAILDGELYADKLSQDFNKIISLVRKKNPNAAALAESANTVEYHIYDCPTIDGPFADRKAFIDDMFAEFDPDMCVNVDTYLVESQADLDEFNGHFNEEGYEGQIIRISDTPYEQRRVKQLLKRKQFDDDEFEIVSINEGDGNRRGMAGFITYKNATGTEFGSGIKGSHDYAKQLLKDADNYVGGTGTVKYFGLTPNGVPRFPVTIAVYEGKRTT